MNGKFNAMRNYSSVLLGKKELKIIDVSPENILLRFMCEGKLCSYLLKMFCINFRWEISFISNSKLIRMFAVLLIE